MYVGVFSGSRRIHLFRIHIFWKFDHEIMTASARKPQKDRTLWNIPNIPQKVTGKTRQVVWKSSQQVYRNHYKWNHIFLGFTIFSQFIWDSWNHLKRFQWTKFNHPSFWDSPHKTSRFSRRCRHMPGSASTARQGSTVFCHREGAMVATCNHISNGSQLQLQTFPHFLARPRPNPENHVLGTLMFGVPDEFREVIRLAAIALQDIPCESH